MKNRLIIAALAAITLGGFIACSTITPQQQATITLTEKTLAVTAQVAAPLVSNKTISDSLYALGVVANAYGNAPVPANIIQATTPLPGLAGTVLPIITGKANGPKAVNIINGAAAILAGLGGTASSAPVTTGS